MANGRGLLLLCQVRFFVLFSWPPIAGMHVHWIMRNTDCPMGKQAVQCPSTTRDTLLVDKLALASYLWQILTHWLTQSSLHWSQFSLISLFFPVMSLELHLYQYVVFHTHVSLDTHVTVAYVLRSCGSHNQPSKCVTHIENYVFWLAPDKYNFTKKPLTDDKRSH